jgi:hypothetical protein
MNPSLHGFLDAGDRAGSCMNRDSLCSLARVLPLAY